MIFLFKNREYLKFLMDREQWQDALPIALHLASDSASDSVALATVYGHLGDELAVDRVIQESMNTWPSDPMPAIWWSVHQLDLGLIDRAHEGACAINLGADQAAFYYHSLMARIYDQVGDREEALCSAKKATVLAGNSEQKESSEIIIAKILLNQLKPGDALERLKGIIDVNPRSEAATLLIVEILTVYQQWQDLHCFLESVCSIAKPSIYKRLHQSMITCLVEMRDYSEADRLIEYYSLTSDKDDIFLNAIKERLSIVKRNFNRKKEALEKLIGESD
jgi:tetratricopeptide (TPR) repeat protein